MWRHDFQALGECGHKRNFTYYHGKKKPMESLRAYCMICSGDDKLIETKYKVIRYLEEIKEGD